MRWKTPFIKNAFKHFCKANWNSVRILDSKQYCSSFSIGEQNVLLYTINQGRWIISLIEKDSVKKVGDFNGPENLTEEQMIQKFSSLFHPIRQNQMAKWIQFLKNTAHKHNPNCLSITYTGNNNILEIDGSNQEMHDFMLDIPDDAYNNLCHILKTTAHADYAGEISNHQTLAMNPPKTAHEHINTIIIAEQFMKSGFV